MDAVYKYEIPIDEDYPVVMLPEHAEVLSAGAQNGLLFLWARVSTDAPVKPRRFRLAGTEHLLAPDVGTFIGTIRVYGAARAPLVFHLFETVAVPGAR